MKKENWYKLIVVTIFAIAMAFLETAVVVYLRKIYYTTGFDFPLTSFFDPSILLVEWIRELATIIMLVTLGMLAGKKLSEKFAYFLYAFAIWDIFYYIFLKLTLSWPSSLLTWDLLFLIPIPWIGPVITPVICAIIMIVVAKSIIIAGDKGIKINIKPLDWILIFAGIGLILYSWVVDYAVLIFSGRFASQFFSLAYSADFLNAIANYSPMNYNWFVYWIGIILNIIAIARIFLRLKKKK